MWSVVMYDVWYKGWYNTMSALSGHARSNDCVHIQMKKSAVLGHPDWNDIGFRSY